MSNDSEKKEDPAMAMLTAELAGKHNAAQVYDERIWKIRTGFLTLAFASWGALLAVGDSLAAAREGAAPLLVLTLALAVAGFVVEVFYVCRKFRCIEVINEMSVGVYEILRSDETAPKDVELWLSFSGDEKKIRARKFPMFRWGVMESMIIYAAPTAGFALAYILFFAK